jgi:hypothetical protein
LGTMRNTISVLSGIDSRLGNESSFLEVGGFGPEVCDQFSSSNLRSFIVCSTVMNLIKGAIERMCKADSVDHFEFDKKLTDLGFDKTLPRVSKLSLKQTYHLTCVSGDFDAALIAR